MDYDENMSNISDQGTVEVIDIANKINCPKYKLNEVKKITPGLALNQHFTDYQFSLPPHKDHNHIKIKRLSEIYSIQTNLFLDLKTGRELTQPTKQKKNSWTPTYLSEINMLPFKHYCNLIEPCFVNQYGFYTVVVQKDGILYKEIIDDKFYFDEKLEKIVSHHQLENHLWIHILIKVWAKINKGYQNLINCEPFAFIRAFSFPDWEIMNPSKQKKQSILFKLANATNRSEYLITKTKSNQKVGYYGFPQHCSSFVIKGHYQQYGDIYLKLQSFVYGGWNKNTSSAERMCPEENPALEQNQFIIPLHEYINNFHLIYSTSNKYIYSNKPEKDKIRSFSKKNQINSISYDRYTLNIDAMQRNAFVLGLELQYENHQKNELSVGLSFYFPFVKITDLLRTDQDKDETRKFVVPWCKLLVAQLHDSNQLDVHYVESVKQKMLYSHDPDQASFTVHTSQHDFIIGEYFKGFSNELSYNLRLKPGKYLIRLKVEEKLLQYRTFISTTVINGQGKFFDPKLSSLQQLIMLKDCLFKKALKEKKNITFVNPAKRGSWISCRNEYQILGYSYIAVHVVKNPDNKLLIKISPKKLKQHGYISKGHKDMKQYEVILDSDQNTLIILKYDKQWVGQKRIWPPPGIEISKVPRSKNPTFSQKSNNAFERLK